MDNTDQLQHALGRGLPPLLRAASSTLVPTEPTQRDTLRLHRRSMWVLVVLAVVHWGCVFPASARKAVVDWPHPDSTPLVGAPMEAGAALAAAAAVREMVKQNTSQRLFRGCSSPEQGLDVAIFKDPKSGLYYVVLHQRFDRCGGPYVRVLDGWYEYAVTAQGEVLGKAPPMAWQEPPPPAASPPAAEAGTPAPTPAPVPASPPAPAGASSSSPAVSPAPETPGPASANPEAS